MTVCKTCNGLGKIKLMPFGYICTCAECKGTGETRDYMTNEEYLKSCNTEQLANFIIKAMLFYDNAGITVLEAIKNAVEDNENLSSYFMESVLEWLKQPHDNILKP